MTPGVKLAQAHFESVVSNRVDDFDDQVSDTFRYEFLPPVFGAGPAMLRRWCATLFSIYRQWSFEITDAHEDKDSVVVRVNWRGFDPASPGDTAPEFIDVAMFAYTIKNGKFTQCTASYLEYDEHEELKPQREKYSD
jgi:hypothetical protein